MLTHPCSAPAPLRFSGRDATSRFVHITLPAFQLAQASFTSSAAPACLLRFSLHLLQIFAESSIRPSRITTTRALGALRVELPSQSRLHIIPRSRCRAQSALFFRQNKSPSRPPTAGHLLLDGALQRCFVWSHWRCAKHIPLRT